MAFGNGDESLRITPSYAPLANGVEKREHSDSVLHPSLVLRTKETPDPEGLGLEEELPGWHGYVEWEKYPERKDKVKEYMRKFEFPGVSKLVFDLSNLKNGHVEKYQC